MRRLVRTDPVALSRRRGAALLRIDATRPEALRPCSAVISLVLLTALLAAIMFALRPSHATAAPGRLRLGQEPYAGVRCARPNSIACDRIGLAVWLVRPAVRLTASISGKRIRMMIPARVRAQASGYYCARRCYFEGALRPAGMLAPGPLHVTPDAGRFFWAGRHPRPLLVHLAAFYRDGTSAATAVRTWLHPGWG